MEYQKYIEKAKNKVKNLTVWEKSALGALCLVLVGVGIYFYNPQKQLLEMRNTQRRSDVTSILDATYQYASDHGGNLPFALTAVPIAICKSGASSCAGALDFSLVIAGEKNELSGVPVDPRENDPNISGYQISKSASGRINVSAPLAENNAVISLSK